MLRRHRFVHLRIWLLLALLLPVVLLGAGLIRRNGLAEPASRLAGESRP